jgi:hypothetical protein
MNKKRPMTEVVDQRKETIPEVVHEYKEMYSRVCG